VKTLVIIVIAFWIGWFGYKLGKNTADQWYAQEGCVKLIAPLKYKVPQGDAKFE